MATRKKPLYIPLIFLGVRVPLSDDFKTRAEWEQKAWQLFIKEIASRSEQEISKILNNILTLHERRTALLRLAVINRIEHGASYKEIGRELGVSPQVVSALRRALAEKALVSYWQRSKTERKRRSSSSLLPTKVSNPHYSRRKRRTKYGTFYSNF